MLTGTMAFLLGVVLCQLQSELPTSLWPVALLLLIPLMIFPLQRRLAVLLLALLFGYGWSVMLAQQGLDERLPQELEGREVLLQGVVAALPQHDARRSRFVFAPQHLSVAGRDYPPPRRVRLSWYHEAEVEAVPVIPGQRWQLLVKLKRPRGMINPAGFDYERWLFQEGIGATGYVRASAQNRLLGHDWLAAPLEQLRYHLQQVLGRALGAGEYGGIIRALAMGDRHDISDGQWALLLATGTNHLVAISGLHIGLVAGLSYLLLLQLWRLCSACSLYLAAPRAAAVMAMVVAFCYAALAGFSVPTQRALLMLALLMGALFWQRPLQPSRLLALALLLVTLHQPLVVLSAGFWLSFAAVALILYGMGGRLNPRGLWWRWGRVQWLVALGLMPLLLLLFGQASFIAPVANVIAVPWVGLLVVPLTLLGTLLLGLWGSAGELLLQLAEWLMGLLWPLLQFLAEIAPAIQLASPPGWAYLLALPGVLWLLAPAGWPLRALGVVPLLPLLLWQPQPLAHGVARFTLLDVGQGLAAIVETRNHLLVFDTGPRFRSGFDTGSAVVLPFLRHHGYAAIDTLLISHGDSDHIGGARSLSEGLPPRRVLTSVPHKMGWIAHESCRRGEQWQWDGVQFELLHPLEIAGQGRGNNSSCVLQVRAAGQSLLLTGDIEQQAERELVALYGATLRSDIVVAPHHGSNSSSSDAFIRATAPTWVLLPLGYRNRYGFPRPQVVERYQHYGVKMLSSAEAGAITLLLGAGSEPRPEAYRQFARRYWHSRDM